MKTIGPGVTPQQVKTAIKIINEFIADDAGFERNKGKGKEISPFFFPGKKRLTSGDFHEIPELRREAIRFLDSKGIFERFSVSFHLIAGKPLASRLEIERLPGEVYPEFKAGFRDIEQATFFAIAYLIRYSGSELYRKEGYKIAFETACNFYKLT
jgi:hypothetical protein